MSMRKDEWQAVQKMEELCKDLETLKEKANFSGEANKPWVNLLLGVLERAQEELEKRRRAWLPTDLLTEEKQLL